MIKALDNQTLFDMAVMHAGSIEAAFLFADAQGMSVTDELAGQELDGAEVIDESVVFFFSQTSLKPPASADTNIVLSSPDQDTVYVRFAPGSRNAFEVKDNQTLFDYAVQHAGSVEGAFDMADANGIGITDDLSAGLVLRRRFVSAPKVAKFFNDEGFVPASAMSADAEAPDTVLEGIGYWSLVVEFKVS